MGRLDILAAVGYHAGNQPVIALLFLLILGPLVLYCCLPKRVQDDVADWARMIVGVLVVLSVAIWIISVIWQILTGLPAADISPPPGR